MAYVLLLFSIVAEVCGTMMMKLSEGFSKRKETIAMVLAYVIAFYLVSLVLLTLPLSITYAIWAGAGTICTALIGIIFFKEKFGAMNIIGMLLLLCGLTLINFV